MCVCLAPIDANLVMIWGREAACFWGLGKGLVLVAWAPLESWKKLTWLLLPYKTGAPCYFPRAYYVQAHCCGLLREDDSNCFILILVYYVQESGSSQRNRTSRRDILRDLLQGIGLYNCSSWLGKYEIHRWWLISCQLDLVPRYFVRHYSGYFCEDAFRWYWHFISSLSKADCPP